MEVRAGFSGMDREAAETVAALFVDSVLPDVSESFGNGHGNGPQMISEGSFVLVAGVEFPGHRC
jgi:hypothetical protein